ncbi:MFS transporter [Paenibacillus sp. FJAT-26967]|uniref:MFS transporter n=1 Tax=Paenibacillus sp. FJAT-26967 TaxID=1729690 RepID=UPI000B0B5330|nr:MFS transporter [Paenibacillus sp. FJAT-26967]
MSSNIRKMLMMNFVSSIIFIYIGIFINLYIWQVNNSIFEVSWFNLVMFIGWGISFVLGARMLYRQTIRLLLALSAVSGAAAFLLLTFLTLDNRNLWIAMIGLPVGLMWGFYTVAQNLSVSFSGKGSEVASFFAANNLIAQVLSMVIPIVSAQFIGWFGYESSFILMFVFVIIMLLFSYTMPKISMPLSEGPQLGFWKELTVKKVFGSRQSVWLVLSILAGGVFLQFQNLFTLVFTFTVTQDKLLIALLNVLYTGSAFLGLVLYRKFKWNDNLCLWLGVILLSAGFVVALFPLHPLLILSNVLTAFGMFFFAMIWNAQQFHCIENFPPARKAAFLIWREGLLIGMRIILLVFIMQLQSLDGWLYVALIGITLISLILIPVFQTKAVKVMVTGRAPSSPGTSISEGT